MAQNTSLMEKYSNLVDAKLRAECIFEALFNSRHDGDAAAGAVKIPVRNEASVGAYTISTGATLANPTTSYVSMICDKDFAINELIDGFVASAVPDNLVAERLESGAYALGAKIDSDLAGVLVSAGTAESSTTALTAQTAYSAIIDSVQTAKTSKVNPRSMWIAVSPATYGLLLKSAEFQSAAGSTADLGAGFVGKIAGIPVYETLDLPTKTEYVVGNSDFCHFVKAWKAEPEVVDLADGAHIKSSAVQGRVVYGFAVSQATTVRVKKYA